MTAATPPTQQRLAFFAAGLLFSLAAFYVSFRWPEIYESVFREGFQYDSQPPWYRISGVLVAYLPLVSIGVVVLLRVAYHRAVRPLAYGIGVGAFYVGLFAFLVYAQAHSPF